MHYIFPSSVHCAKLQPEEKQRFLHAFYCNAYNPELEGNPTKFNLKLWYCQLHYKVHLAIYSHLEGCESALSQLYKVEEMFKRTLIRSRMEIKFTPTRILPSLHKKEIKNLIPYLQGIQPHLIPPLLSLLKLYKLSLWDQRFGNLYYWGESRWIQNLILTPNTLPKTAQQIPTRLLEADCPWTVHRQCTSKHRRDLQMEEDQKLWIEEGEHEKYLQDQKEEKELNEPSRPYELPDNDDISDLCEMISNEEIVLEDPEKDLEEFFKTAIKEAEEALNEALK